MTIATHSTAVPPEKAVLIGFTPTKAEHEDTLAELALLTDTAGAEVAGQVLFRRSSIHPGTFLSSGKLEEARELVARHKARLVICDEDLTPAQCAKSREGAQSAGHRPK